MHWANYFRNVVQPYQVMVEGWPANIPFVNLSEASSALPDLEMLERKWRSGAVYWRRLGDEEFQRLLEERNEKLERGEIVEHRRRTRSDKGKKQAHSPDGSGRNTCKKTYKSAETVNTDDEDDASASPNNSTDTSANTQNNADIDNDNQVNTNINTGAVSDAHNSTGAIANTDENNSTGAIANTHSDTANLFDPSTSFNFFDPTATNGSLLPQYESFDPDEMLANLDSIFGPAAQYS
jgi:hypothetical protein